MPTLAERVAAMKAGTVPGAVVPPVVPGVVAPPVVAPGIVIPPVVAPVVVPPVVAPVVAAPGPLNGGGRLASIREALKTATTGGKRDSMPLGTAIFLLKSGIYKVTEGSKYKLTSFSFLCMQAMHDASGIGHGTPGYAGAIPGESYEVPIFIDLSPKYVKGTMGKSLGALQACMGWTGEQTKTYQKEDAQVTMLFELLKGMFCVDFGTETPTGQPSIFSGQVIIQLSTKVSIVDKKVDGNDVFDASGNKVTKPYTNTYWDKRIFLDDLDLPAEQVIAAFGSQDAMMAAYQNEQALRNAT